MQHAAVMRNIEFYHGIKRQAGFGRVPAAKASNLDLGSACAKHVHAPFDGRIGEVMNQVQYPWQRGASCPKYELAAARACRSLTAGGDEGRVEDG